MNKSRVKTYLITSEKTNLIKIGKSTSPKKRLKELQCGSSEVLKISHIFDADIERLLHINFNDKRSHGEWFSVTLMEVLSYVEKSIDLNDFQESTNDYVKKYQENSSKIVNDICLFFDNNKIDEDGYLKKWLDKEERYTDYGMPYYVKPKYKDIKIQREYDMINMIVFGKTEAMLRISLNVHDYDDLGPSLSKPYFNVMRDLQRANTVYIEDGLDFQDRKVKLQSLFDRKHKQKLINEVHLLNA